jgi:hypothetical protein
MIPAKLTRYLLALSVPVFLELAIAPNFLATTQAQTKSPNLVDLRLKQVTFEPRTDKPAPTITVGGGRRNEGVCSQERKASEASITEPKSLARLLTPLLPSPSSDLHLTVSAHPTFLVYVPQTSAKTVELTLEDRDGKGIYQRTINLTGTPGIVRFSLPASTPELEIGKDYRWLVLMNCQPSTAEDPFAEGLVRRIKPDSSLSQVDGKKPLEQVSLYAKSGIWYDAVANLAALQKAQPNNPEVTSAWENLLRGVGLDAIANAPLNN